MYFFLTKTLMKFEDQNLEAVVADITIVDIHLNISRSEEFNCNDP